MSALDAPDPPRDTSPGALARHRRFRAAPDRLRFALAQPVLDRPGRVYQYNDVTPMLAIGLVQYAAGTTALAFADAHLFGPLGFRHHEWMHQDATGHDLGGYGLRLRPIDMQKLGVLYLQGGAWGGRRLVSADWVARSFTPWIRSRPEARDPDYGWFWWGYDGPAGWPVQAAHGWKGQRIAVLPRERLVVTMTAVVEDGSEHRVFNELLHRFVVRAVRGDGPRRADPAARARLATLLEQVRTGPSRLAPGTEPRMVPSAAPKERRVPFRAAPPRTSAHAPGG
jgi:CubicO group peptidase (beta-lactamase class C family)